ncbi:hypothetical protein N0V82_002010 [Gnomoniopsis sp. IMI 355080]|nr:hypothetical protein N0V82_002010 [Gnomoniopsis sp. IMI 355080]
MLCLFRDGTKAVVPLAAMSRLSYSYPRLLARLCYCRHRHEAAWRDGRLSTLAWTQLVVMAVNSRPVSIARKGGSGKVWGGEKVGGGGTSEVEG